MLVILYGSLRLSISQGDAKAIQGAKATLTWGVIGFLAVISVYVIFNITAGVFGLGDGAIPSLEDAITELLKWLNDN